jgi:hypothetical protein
MRWSWTALLALVVGCRGTDVVPVTGRVTLDGKPLPNATVVFQPVGGSPNPGMGSSGRTDAEGTFVLRQIQPNRPGSVRGMHLVRITLASTTGVSEGNPGVERLPACYNSQTTLTWDVIPGDTRPVVFALSSTAK